MKRVRKEGGVVGSLQLEREEGGREGGVRRGDW